MSTRVEGAVPSVILINARATFAAGRCAGGYEPGTIERGLLEGFAQGTL